MCEHDGKPYCDCPDEVKHEQPTPSEQAVWGRSIERGEEQQNYSTEPPSEPSTEMPDFSSPSPGEEDTTTELLSPEGRARRGLVHPLSEEDTGISDYQLGVNPPGRIPATPGRSGSSEVFRGNVGSLPEVKKTLSGVWSDSNGFLTYFGDPQVLITDQDFTDVQAFLEDHGFVEEGATGVPSPSDQPVGSKIFQHNSDGRSITFATSLSPYGFQTIVSAHAGSNDPEGNPFEIETVDDMIQFVLLGRETTAPIMGGEVRDNSNDIDDQIQAAQQSGNESQLSSLLQTRASRQYEAENS